MKTFNLLRTPASLLSVFPAKRVMFKKSNPSVLSASLLHQLLETMRVRAF